MRILTSVAAALLLGVTSLQTMAETEVKFIKPLGFDDIGNHGADVDKVLANVSNLGQLMIQRAGYVLKPGQDMKITVTNVHLAGAEVPAKSGTASRRVFRPSLPPSMKFSYVVTEGDKVIREGNAEITDENFSNRFVAHYQSDNLLYERVMLDDWFSKEFGMRVLAYNWNTRSEPQPPWLP